MKQITIRQLGRQTAKTLRNRAFEVLDRRKPIGRYLPYEQETDHRAAPQKVDFVADMEHRYGPLKNWRKSSATHHELSELGGLS